MADHIGVVRVSCVPHLYSRSWVLLTRDSGEERWRSEGIQVGGLRSQRGVIGTWFDKDYDPHGPAGPTAFWKLSDRVVHDEGSDSEEEMDPWDM
jgi:hypothetical protein